ncbi:transmembrane channel-like protein 2 [Sitophilus oryzae]|uniref:Transmembrane channel-like protein 2 n=1 Tax=Sitophilus oryzae TaxID=7048 RepID=A0A6J2YF83_SITOR|nr:transmembrane channel-like protein 2 [Sitophilus oryzae]
MEKSPELYLPTSILRLDSGRSRKLSSEFKRTQKEEVSPQPSVDRLSVTFAESFLKTEVAKMQQEQIQPPEAAPEPTGSDDEDYSISVNAIIQRRASTRRSKKRNRRASSPFSPETPVPERRRSSVFTTSSGDTAITVDGDQINEVTQDEIFENIKLHKEVLSNVKMQPWNMRKKLKLVLQAKAYIKKHEGQLQERLAQSHSTRDMLARYNIVLIKKWQIWKRELTNMSMWFIPWELKIKEIESHFGSVVASYFIFLRWLFWVNIVIAVVIISFVTIPEIITADPEAVKERKYVLPEEKYNSTNFLTLWDFEGVFKYSPLFYGWYTNRDYNESAVSNSIDKKSFREQSGYRLPFAYFVTGLVVYAYSFFATLRKMAENSRMSKLSEKDDECIFSWKLFTAWDYMIGNAETAHNRVASIVTGFKEALLEETEKKRESRNWKVICFRILVNSLVVGLLSFSAFAVVVVVKRSTEKEANSTVWRRNEITVVMSLITVFFPMLFEILGFLEQYHPRKQLMLQLARIMVLNLLNLYSLIFALFYKISDMKEEYHENFKTNPAKPTTTDVALYTSSSPSSLTSTVSSLTDNKTLETCLCTEPFFADITSTVIPSNLTDIAENLMQRVLTTVSQFALEHFNSTPTETASTEYFNITELNMSISNSTIIDNEKYFNYSTYSLDDLKESFVDYLTYILSQFNYFNVTDLNGSNVTLYNSLNISNETSFNQNSTENYEYFKSTVLPVFNNTWPEEEERFETDLTTVFQEVSTTLATFYTTESVSTTSAEEYNINLEESEYCINYCNKLMESKNAIFNSTETSTAVSVTLVDMIEEKETLNYTTRARLRSLCWETMFGQELIKLTVMDLIMTVLSTLAMDFFRGIFVRVMNRCWCWDLEKKFPQYGDFKVAENILHLVNNQGMVWLGMFFSPGLVVLNVVKLYIMMYLRAWAVLTCNVPHEVIFRASKSNNFYYALLLLMLFLSVLAVGYAVVKVEPSWHCGPFSGYHFIFHIFTKTIKDNVPQQVFNVLDYFSSPGIVIPLLVFLIMFIYYLISLTGALREANNDLKIQLRRERTEERRKMFEMVDRRRRCGSGESNDQTPFSKWKKLIGNLPSTRSCDETPRQESDEIVVSQKEEEVEKVESKSRVFFTKLIKKALRKSSTSDEEQDGTDVDQHDSLPYDTNKDESTKEQKSGIERHTLKNIVSKAWLRKNDHKEEKKHHDVELKNIRSSQQEDLENKKSKITTPSSSSPKEPPSEKNDFLKRILQAKKSGVFDDKITNLQKTINHL